MINIEGDQRQVESSATTGFSRHTQWNQTTRRNRLRVSFRFEVQNMATQTSHDVIHVSIQTRTKRKDVSVQVGTVTGINDVATQTDRRTRKVKDVCIQKGKPAKMLLKTEGQENGPEAEAGPSTRAILENDAQIQTQMDARSQVAVRPSIRDLGIGRGQPGFPIPYYNDNAEITTELDVHIHYSGRGHGRGRGFLLNYFDGQAFQAYGRLSILGRGRAYLRN